MLYPLSYERISLQLLGYNSKTLESILQRLVPKLPKR